MAKYEFTCEVRPQYLASQSSPQDDVYRFAYTIEITNTGEVAAQLISRHWFISDAQGRTEEVKGLGVVGHQPLIKPGGTFQYSSGCQLRTVSGTMHGTYFFVAEDGERFEASIPLFVLEAGGVQGAPAKRVLH